MKKIILFLASLLIIANHPQDGDDVENVYALWNTKTHSESLFIKECLKKSRPNSLKNLKNKLAKLPNRQKPDDFDLLCWPAWVLHKKLSFRAYFDKLFCRYNTHIVKIYHEDKGRAALTHAHLMMDLELEGYDAENKIKISWARLIGTRFLPPIAIGISLLHYTKNIGWTVGITAALTVVVAPLVEIWTSNNEQCKICKEEED